MALMLLHEQQKGKNSVVSGYIEQLPAEFDTLLHWSSEELQLLMYPPLIQQVSVYGDWQSLHAACIASLCSYFSIVTSWQQQATVNCHQDKHCNQCVARACCCARMHMHLLYHWHFCVSQYFM